MEGTKRKIFLTLKTSEGCRHLLTLLIAAILVFSFAAALVSSNGGKVKISHLKIEARGAELDIDQYIPVGTSDSSNLPCVLLAHGRGANKNVLRGVAEELSRRGFVVLNVNAYGMGLSEQPIHDDGGQGAGKFAFYAGPFGEYDALNFARTLKYVDPTRIALFGHSLGSSRVNAAVALDLGGNYTFNDIMINVLADTFGQTFTQDEISQNADDLAVARLNADQRAYYDRLRDEKKAVFDTRVNTIVLTGSTAAPAAAAVKVAGYEVMRECPVNVILINGKYDSLGAGASWNVDGTTKPDVFGGVQIANWYKVASDNTGYTKIGALDDTSILNNKSLAGAIGSRCGRIALYANSSHSGEYFSNEVNTYLVKTLSQAFEYNRGDLSDPATKPLNANSNIWPLRALFNLICELCMVAMLFPIIGLLTRTKFFAPCAIEKRESVQGDVNKATYWILSGVVILFTFLALYEANTRGPTWASAQHRFPPNIFVLVTTTAIADWFVIWLTLISLAVLIVKVVFTKKATGRLGLREMNIGMKVPVFLKTLLIGVIVIASANAMLVVIERLFNQDFHFFQTMFTEMKIEHWFMALPYIISFFILFAVIGLSINFGARTDLSESREMILTVIVNSVGVWALWLIDMLLRANWSGKPFSDFTLSYSMLLFVPITVYISRKMYKMTNSIWLGAFVNATLLSWTLFCSAGIADYYYGQNIISVIFGV